MALNMEEMEQELDRIRAKSQRAQSGGTTFQQLRFYNFRQYDGKNTLRICPPIVGDKQFVPRGRIAFPVYKHQNVPGSPNSKEICVALSFPNEAKACPICEVIHKLERWVKTAGQEGMVIQNMLRGHWLVGRAHANVIDRQSKLAFDPAKNEIIEVDPAERASRKLFPVVQIASFPMGVYNWLVEQVSSKDEDGTYIYGDITDPDKGYDVLVPVTGVGKKTEYKPSINPKAKPIEGGKADNEARTYILNNLYDLNLIWRMPTDAKFDNIVAIAKKAEALISKDIGALQEVSAAQRNVPNEETSVMGTVIGASQTKPICFTNHVESLDGVTPFEKCMYSCPVEAACKEETEKLGKPIDECIAVHKG